MPQRTLTACADPNNLPFSNKAGQGFENKLAQLIASDLHAKLDYVWWAQRRGYVRNTLNERECDFWPGVGSNVEMLATSRPYYRSTYMFVSRASADLEGLTLDDPRLKQLKIGVQMVGNDGSNTPPAHALSRRGIVDNVRGYMLYGDYSKPNPPAADRARGRARRRRRRARLGAAAGYFAAQSPVPLRLEPVTPGSTTCSGQCSSTCRSASRRTTRSYSRRWTTSSPCEAGTSSGCWRAYHVPQVRQ